MDQLVMKTVVASWKLIVSRLDERFAQLDDEQLKQPIAPNKNRLFYLLGHLTAVHDRMLPMLGIFPNAFILNSMRRISTNPDRTIADPLSASELKRAWS